MIANPLEYTPLHTQQGLNAYLSTRRTPPPRLTIDEYLLMGVEDRAAHDEARRLHHASGIFIRTRSVKTILEELDDIVDTNLGTTCGNTGLVISGNAALGKTTIDKAAMLHTMASVNARRPNWQAAGKQPCVYIEVPATSTGRSLAARFASFLGMTVMQRETMDRILDRVVATLIAANTELIVIDEIQRLSAKDQLGREAINTLKTLHNRLSTTTFLYSGIDVLHSDVFAGDTGGQLLSRMESHEVLPHKYVTASQKEGWAALLRQIETNLRLIAHEPGTLEQHAEYLHQKSRGSIGRLMRVLTKAANRTIRTAEHPEQEQLTLASLQRVKLDMAGQAQLEAETSRARLKKAGGR